MFTSSSSLQTGTLPLPPHLCQPPSLRMRKNRYATWTARRRKSGSAGPRCIVSANLLLSAISTHSQYVLQSVPRSRHSDTREFSLAHLPPLHLPPPPTLAIGTKSPKRALQNSASIKKALTLCSGRMPKLCMGHDNRECTITNQFMLCHLNWTEFNSHRTSANTMHMGLRKNYKERWLQDNAALVKQ